MVLLELLGVALGAAAINGVAKRHQKKPETKPIPKTFEKRLCPNCGKSIRTNAIRCVHCNYYFKEGKVMPKHETNNTFEKRLCPNCGELIKANAIRCVHCNYYFKQGKVMPKHNQTALNTKSSYPNSSSDENLNQAHPETNYKGNSPNHDNTELAERANYCPNCNVTYHGKEKFCRICHTKLIIRLEHDVHKNITINQTTPSKNTIPKSNNSKKQTTRTSKRVRPKRNIDTNKYKDNPIIDDRPKGAEFTDGKSREELLTELNYVTRKLEDCQKSGDYMMSYYKGKKEILEKALGKN